MTCTILREDYNIAFAFWGAPIDREKVLQCCHMAAMDFIDTLPEGIDTYIGERGVRLSGGQVQRIAIARALYADPELLIFDEATSALDTANEALIQKAVNSLKGQRTMVIIAHRLSTVEECDRIYWLEQGQVKVMGSPSEVLPVYAQSLKAE